MASQTNGLCDCGTNLPRSFEAFKVAEELLRTRYESVPQATRTGTENVAVVATAVHGPEAVVPRPDALLLLPAVPGREKALRDDAYSILTPYLGILP